MAAITHKEVLRAAQAHFEMRIAQSLRNHVTHIGADAARRDAVARYAEWMAQNNLVWLDATLPLKCEEWCTMYAQWISEN